MPPAESPLETRIACRLLRFGIPSLDVLFDPSAREESACGMELPTICDSSGNPAAVGATSLCIAGPSGTGKSILALHLAARYYADCLDRGAWETQQSRPSIIYASTDLTYERANDTWRRFCLDQPNSREVPFGRVEFLPPLMDNLPCDLRLRLTNCTPFDPVRLVNSLEFPIPSQNKSEALGEVVFLDLASSTAGDDWHFINRLISLLRPPNPVQGLAPKHFVIIDAVEGLEMLTGERDLHGEIRTRRSRIAQVLRAAKGKCHVAFVLEERNEFDCPPEEYVTDVVLRLRCQLENNYQRRTLEILKSRGGSSARGAHHYVIRPEKAQSLAPDDPKCGNSYFHVIPSLHFLTRHVMHHPLGNEDEESQSTARLPSPDLPGVLPDNGLPRGAVTVITGDEATMKGRLARAFLAGCFDRECSPKGTQEIAVVISTHNNSARDLANRIAQHLDPTSQDSQSAANVIPRRLVFRQLEVHDITSPILFHTIRRCVEKALEIHGSLNHPTSPLKSPLSWHGRHPWAPWIRLVIDDWSVIESSYPAVASDTHFLPFLIRYLESVGVTTLMVDTRAGRPDQIFSSEAKRHLRSLARYHLFTWHVPFFGQDRVAIAGMPPLRDSLPNVVAELRPDHERGGNLDERLCGDPHFELYRGLASGSPELVPLEVQLFASAEGFLQFSEQMNSILDRVFVPNRGEHIIVPQDARTYASLRDFAVVHGGTRLNHTLVYQVDEYWSSIHAPRHGNLGSGYLSKIAAFEGGKSNNVDDPFGAYQRAPLESLTSPGTLHKHDFFPVSESYGEDWHKRTDAVPYLWDFGILLLDEDAWITAVAELKRSGSARFEEVQRAWIYATWIPSLETHLPEEPPPPPQLTWCDFLRAASDVARINGEHGSRRFVPFDCDLLSPQSLACLFLEIWTSEIAAVDEQLRRNGRDARVRQWFDPSRLLGLQPKVDLVEMANAAMDEFLAVLLLLGEVLDISDVVNSQGTLSSRAAPRRAAAERHWYSTAGDAPGRPHADDTHRYRPGRVPGRYIVRGDWFLAVAEGSWSVRLGERAIDLLSRRRANWYRLELGIGLPVRDILLHHHNLANDRSARTEVSHLQQSQYERIETALRIWEDPVRQRRLTYRELREYGAVPGAWRTEGPGSGLQWFWRSQIRDYHRHDRVFERWMGRFLTAAARWNRSLNACQINGFEARDRLLPENLPADGGGWPEALGAVRTEFLAMLAVMQKELQKLSVSHPGQTP